MATTPLLDRGRESFERRKWSDAYAHLSATDKENPLNPEDLELLAITAYLIGKDGDSIDTLTRAHHEFLSRDDVKQAVRCAFWLGMQLMNKGEQARSGGWFARAQRLVDESHIDCVEKGLLLVPVALQYLGGGDAKNSYAIFEQAGGIADRFNDPDLMTLSRLGRGQALIQQGKITEGVSLLDESMVAVDSGEISPIASGIVYCAVIETCQKIYDIRRAQEWTTALSRWCESQPDMVPFRGQCLVRRAEILQLHGEWPEAMNEVQRACQFLTQPHGEPAAGEAYYRQAELYRLYGEFDKAEDTYREASKWGRKPQPGLSMLRLTQGQMDAAQAAIQNALNEAKNILTRARILPAYIEIMLACNTIEYARKAMDELSTIASNIDATFIQAVSAYCLGTVLYAEGNDTAALKELRKASTLWNELDTPYETARTRVLIGLIYQKLDDIDTADLEFKAAQWIFKQLEAIPDLTRVTSLIKHTTDRDSYGLTLRELQVLRLLATGETNKSIAARLFISERTVDRHLSNIFNKLGVSSRTAATSWAYKHQLL
jgi:ATP/maltotriose-dependent transcriptional regulator MalT